MILNAYDTQYFNQPGSQSVGSLVHIKMMDDGTVVESGYQSNANGSSFTFTTMTSPLDLNHPVSGNRQFGIYPDPNNPGSYNPNNGTITIQDPSTLSLPILQEELLHAYQNFNITGGSAQYHTGYVGSSNIEFETKLLRDISAYVNGLGNGYAVQTDPNYLTWIDQITNGGTKFPTSYTVIQSNYFMYMTEWQNEQFAAQNAYMSNIVDTNLLPTSMFSLINSSSCTK